jgi:D-glucosaminate-6-phosphate ammonia-lyase
MTIRNQTSAATPRTVYERFGVRPIINAQGTTTTLGGSMMLPEVAAAMVQASGSMVLMSELNDSAGEMISQLTGAEAGLVTAGAAAAMLVQAAAVMTGNDTQKVKQLPDTQGMKNEILILDHHKEIGYLQAWRTAGATLVVVSIDPDDSAAEAVSRIVDSASSNTAAIGYIASRWLRPDPLGFLPALTKAAHSAGIPVIVDAAAMLPPATNLRRYSGEGVDLVCFSGGKAIRAPQSTGILAGSRELIEDARLNAAPNSGVGRSAKVCKEEIVGLMTALQLYVERDHEAEERIWRARAEIVATTLKDVPGVRAAVLQDDHSRPVPETAIFFEEGYRGPTGEQVAQLLLEGEPRIVMGAASARGEDLFVNPHNMAEGEDEIVGARLRAVLSGKA